MSAFTNFTLFLNVFMLLSLPVLDYHNLILCPFLTKYLQAVKTQNYFYILFNIELIIYNLKLINIIFCFICFDSLFISIKFVNLFVILDLICKIILYE